MLYVQRDNLAGQKRHGLFSDMGYSGGSHDHSGHHAAHRSFSPNMEKVSGHDTKYCRDHYRNNTACFFSDPGDNTEWILLYGKTLP